jgi:uncharacterized protein (TIGR03435 family)
MGIPAKRAVPGLALMGMLIANPLSWSQTSPAFDIATVKLSDPQTRPSMDTLPGGRFIAKGVAVRRLIQFAYAVLPLQMRGGPSWLDDRYDIETKIDGAGELSQAELMAPVAALLKDRFRLTTHSETQEQPAYELRVQDKGIKLSRSAPDAPKSFNMGMHGINAQRVSTATFAAGLAQAPDINALVFDETGLTGEFDFKLQWQPSSAALQTPGQTDAPDGPSIFTAVQEQLGLRLVPVRRPMRLLIIDHIERPSAN